MSKNFPAFNWGEKNNKKKTCFRLQGNREKIKIILKKSVI